MELSPSAYPDTFARDHLPPADQWPVLEFTTGLLQYRDRLNAATELIDVPAATWPDRPAVRTPDGVTATYAELLARANQVAQVLHWSGRPPTPAAAVTSVKCPPTFRNRWLTPTAVTKRSIQPSLS